MLFDELAVADLTGGNPNVYYELAIRHGAKKPVIQIKEVSESLPFDIIGTRTIDLDFRFVASMTKCKEEIIKQIQEIENNPEKVDTPIKFTEQPKQFNFGIQEAAHDATVELLKKEKFRFKNSAGKYINLPTEVKEKVFLETIESIVASIDQDKEYNGIDNNHDSKVT